jgi:hypothetical protein
MIPYTETNVIPLRAKNRMKYMAESKLRVVPLRKEELGRLSGSWIEAVNGKERIKNVQ